MITYVDGDATNPIGSGEKIIVHVVNDIGKWGKGFVLSLSSKWPNTKQDYLDWFDGRLDAFPFALGNVLYTKVGNGIIVAHIIGQHGIKSKYNPNPVDYYAIRCGLADIAFITYLNRSSIHMPKIGAGLAGGDWNIIERIIENEITRFGISVTVYNWKG